MHELMDIDVIMLLGWFKRSACGNNKGDNEYTVEKLESCCGCCWTFTPVAIPIEENGITDVINDIID